MSQEAEASRQCPRCYGDIRPEAKRCRHCHSDLDGKEHHPGHLVLANPAVAIPVCTFLYVAFQVFKAADFEVNTAVELVRESGISTMLVGVLLVQLPMELWIAVLLGAWWLVHRRGAGVSRSVHEGAAGRDAAKAMNRLLVGIVPVALALAVSPWPFVILSVGVLAWAAWVLSARPGARRRPVFLATTGAASVVFVAYLLSLPTIWMAAEDIHTADHGDMVGYVVSGDDRWTTILRPTWTHRLPAGTNSLLRQDSSKIDARALCAIDFSDARTFGYDVHLRTLQLPRVFAGDGPPRSLTPPCPSR